MARLTVVFNGPLIDVVIRWITQKPKRDILPLRRKVVDKIGPEIAKQQHQQNQRDELESVRAIPCIVNQHRKLKRRLGRVGHRCHLGFPCVSTRIFIGIAAVGRFLSSLLVKRAREFPAPFVRIAYRNGGAYMMPPCVHCAFRPRARPIGVFSPMFFSKISP